MPAPTAEMYNPSQARQEAYVTLQIGIHGGQTSIGQTIAANHALRSFQQRQAFAGSTRRHAPHSIANNTSNRRRDELQTMEYSIGSEQLHKIELVKYLNKCSGNDIRNLMPTELIPRRYRRPGNMTQNRVKLTDPRGWDKTFLENLKLVIQAADGDRESAKNAMEMAMEARLNGLTRTPNRELTATDLKNAAKELRKLRLRRG